MQEKHNPPVEFFQNLGRASSTSHCSHFQVVQLLLVCGHVVQQAQKHCWHPSCAIHLEVFQSIVYTGSIQVGTYNMIAAEYQWLGPAVLTRTRQTRQIALQHEPQNQQCTKAVKLALMKNQ